MVQLYLNEYVGNFAGRRVCIGCREGILRDHYREIVADIKFLTRNNIATTLFHNLPNRFANQKILSDLRKRLPSTRLIRVPADVSFYRTVLLHPDVVYKLIFLERRYLVDKKGNKINAITTSRVRASHKDFSGLIGNVNFRDILNQVCEQIEKGHCERIHILPAGKNTIKHELFTVEGTGTMVANNFTENFRRIHSDKEVVIVHRILSMYKRSGFLVPRSKQYVAENRHRFFVTEIDDIVVGCVEQKLIDKRTVELGALAISTRFRNQRVGVYTVNSFMKMMADSGFNRFISLTSNPRLQMLFSRLGFVEGSCDEYRLRQEKSPGVTMFFKKFP